MRYDMLRQRYFDEWVALLELTQKSQEGDKFKKEFPGLFQTESERAQMEREELKKR